MASSSITFDRGGNGFNPGSVPDYRGRLRRARLGIAVALTPIIMLFVSFTSAYVMRQGLPMFDEHTGTSGTDWLVVSLPVRLLFFNTVLLVLSSVSIELARKQFSRRAVLTSIESIPGVSLGGNTVPWLAITMILGLAFLTGQYFAWRMLAAGGVYLTSSPSSSFVYLLTVTHAVHLAGGLLALLYAGLGSMMGKKIESRYIVVDTAAWYWHFMALLWIYIFALLEFAR